MKKYLLAVLTVASFSAFAQQAENQITNKMERLNRLIGRGDVSLLSRAEKDELNTHLANALRTLRDDGRVDNGGNNRPGPTRPGPVPGPSRRDTEVKILLSGYNTSYSPINKIIDLSGRNPGEMLQECNAAIGTTMFYSVKKMIATVNNEAYFEIAQAGHNLSANTICSNILSKVDISRPSRPDRLDLIGTLSGYNTSYSPVTVNVQLNGTRAAIMEQCHTTLKSISFYSVREFSLSLNSGRLVNIASKVTGNNISSTEVCAGVFSHINDNIR